MAGAKLAPEVHTTTPDQEKNMEFDFSEDMAEGESITEVNEVTSDFTGSGGPSFVSISHNNQIAEFRIKSPTAGLTYLIGCKVTTNLNQVLEGRGKVLCKALGST